MPNAINYAEKYSRELDQIIKQGSLTADLETPQVNWLNAATFQVPNVAVSGYKNHTRGGGYNRGDVTVTHEPYTLSFDRDIEFFVDKADVDESNQAASAANITRTFLQQNAIPEIDAYRFSKLGTNAVNGGRSTAEDLGPSTVYAALKRDILKARKYGPANLVTYVSSQVMDALEQAPEFTRQISVDNQGTAIETRVTSLDGVELREVWDENRFHTGFDFTAGFTAAVGSYQINFLIVAKPSVIAKPKVSSIYLFAPGEHTEGDGYLYQNRLYHDAFVLSNKEDGVHVSHVTTAN